MINYIPAYIELLREQVNHEINYLHRMGHKNDENNKCMTDNPCIFCVKSGAGDKYHCRRLTDLFAFVRQLDQIPQSVKEKEKEKSMVSAHALKTSSGLLPISHTVHFDKF